MTGELPKLGFGLPVAGPWATPDIVGHIAVRAEELRYASLWTFQRVLYPTGSGLPPPHRTVHDPVVALAYAAGITERIGLGTATLCALLTPPAIMAKTLTSLDVMSAGRLTAGLGMGWLPQEFAAAGVPYERRGARMEEYLRCLEAIWMRDPVRFAGQFYTVPESEAGPAPVQQPHPPVLLGGSARAALRRAGRAAQGWIAASGHDLAGIGEAVQTVRDGASQAGRDAGSLRIVVRAVPDLVGRDPGRGRRPLHGTRPQILDDLARLAGQGVTEVFFDLNLSPRGWDPDTEVAAAVDYAETVLEAFAHLGG